MESGTVNNDGVITVCWILKNTGKTAGMVRAGVCKLAGNSRELLGSIFGNAS